MDLPIKLPASPSTPLFPLSPERVNGTRPPYGSQSLQQSPSLPEFGKVSILSSGSATVNPSSPNLHLRQGRTHSRTHSDALVQGMVARFNQLEIKDHRESIKRDELAMKRVEMAREMAELEAAKAKKDRDVCEAELRKVREELRKCKKDVEDVKDRERKVAKRLDVVMEELQRGKETYTHTTSLYEKEVRRARKEAFKSSSALVKMQEELKAARNTLRITQSGLESERLKCSKREQEAFSAQYRLVGVQEDLVKAEERVKIVEEERDVLMTSLKEEEIARIAAEGRIALPIAKEGDDDFDSPRKSPRKPRGMDIEDKENLLPIKVTEIKVLQEDLKFERRQRERAEDQVEFMKMECQFECCSCRVAERLGYRYVHDGSLNSDIEVIKRSVPETITPPDSPQDAELLNNETGSPGLSISTAMSKSKRRRSTMLISFSPTSGTFKSVASAINEDIESSLQNIMDLDLNLQSPERGTPEAEPAGDEDGPESIKVETTTVCSVLPQSMTGQAEDEKENNDPSTDPAPQTPKGRTFEPPRTPMQVEIRTITTKTTVPVTFSPFAAVANSTNPPTPSTIAHLPTSGPSEFGLQGIFDRERALEQIRQRRGRARSVAMGYATPRKQMLEGIGITGRRDISAPALRGRTDVR